MQMIMIMNLITLSRVLDIVIGDYADDDVSLTLQLFYKVSPEKWGHTKQSKTAFLGFEIGNDRHFLFFLQLQLV